MIETGTTIMLRRIRLPGFTLLELLVVISIIGILVAIGVSSFSVAQRQGRDARRRGDMKALQNAMEQSRTQSTTDEYPTCSSGPSITVGSTTITDPSQVAYVCSTAGVANKIKSYCACATLDNTTAGNGTGCNCANYPCTITTAANNNKFCVVGLQ